MSEFIFIVPSDWTPISNVVVDLVGASQVNLWIALPNMTSLNEALQAQGVVPEGMNVVDAKYFNGEVLTVLFR